MQSSSIKTGEASQIGNSDDHVDKDDLVRTIIDEWLVPALITAFISETGRDKPAVPAVGSLSSQSVDPEHEFEE